MQFPKGKFISMVKVGEKGQIHSVRFNSWPSFSRRAALTLILLFHPTTNSANSSAG